jgi:chromosome segregation ATPase
MRDAAAWVRLPLLAVAAVAAACAPPDGTGVSTSAEARAADREISLPARAPILAGDDGSLAALTAEVRQLRVAVEDLARAQAETQAMGVYLSAQQNRVQRVAAQLDAVRNDLDAATVRSRSFEDELTRLGSALPRITDHQERAGVESAILATEAERNSADLAIQQVRSRESDLSRTLALEEDRLNDLLARVERLTQ